MYDYEQVKAQIKRNRLQVQDVAEKMGVTQTGFIYAYKGQNRVDKDTGKSKYVEANPSINSLNRLAEILNCSVTDFFTENVGAGIVVRCPHCKQTFKATGIILEGEDVKDE